MFHVQIFAKSPHSDLITEEFSHGGASAPGRNVSAGARASVRGILFLKRGANSDAAVARRSIWRQVSLSCEDRHLAETGETRLQNEQLRHRRECICLLDDTLDACWTMLFGFEESCSLVKGP